MLCVMGLSTSFLQLLRSFKVNVEAIILTDSEKALVTCADITEMKDKIFPNTYTILVLSNWETIADIKN